MLQERDFTLQEIRHGFTGVVRDSIYVCTMGFALLLFSFIVLTLSSYSADGFDSFRLPISTKRVGLALNMQSSDNSDLSVPDLQRLLSQVKTWCGLNGLMYTDGDLKWTHAPIGLLPAQYPKETFEKVSRIQPALNELVDRISRDRDFLQLHLEKVSQADPFTKKLLDIYLSLDESAVKSSIQVGILRSDYMMDIADEEKEDKFLQIEINTIASSFGCLSQKVGALHKYLFRRNSGDPTLQALLDLNEYDGISPEQALEKCPQNNPIAKLALTLSFGHHLLARPDAVVLFVVQPGERNVADQRALEAQLWDEHCIKVEFMSLREIEERGMVGDNGDLFVDGGGGRVQVSVVYFRAGYTPDDYPTEAEWNARILIERSSAMKCPSVGYHLAGTKKIQQVLGEDGILESMGVDPDDCRTIRSTFAQQFSLGQTPTSGAEEAVKAAIVDGSNWVLKPQREGGGNNLYGQELSKFLSMHREDESIGGYVLMQRIFPRLAPTVFFRNGKADVHPSISELGIYGTFVGDGEAPMINDYAGYLLRTKPAGVDEGGVATGYSVINSIICT